MIYHFHNPIVLYSFPGQQQIFIAARQQSGANQQPQMFIPYQQSTFLTNTQKPMCSLSPQQSIFALNPQQPIINPGKFFDSKFALISACCF